MGCRSGTFWVNFAVGGVWGAPVAGRSGKGGGGCGVVEGRMVGRSGRVVVAEDVRRCAAFGSGVKLGECGSGG